MANILLVTNTAGGTSDGAQAVGTILSDQGHTLTVRDDGDPIDSTGFDLVVMWDGSFDAGWAIEAVPIVASDNDVATALGLASSSSVGTGQTAINVIDAGHPIAVAAGLQTGLNTVSSGSTACRLNPGAAAPGVAKIARDSTGTDDRIVLAAIDQGGLLIDGETPAPARRVFFGQNQAENWTQLGEDLFLVCCDWAMNASGAPDETAPTLSNATATSTGSTTASGSVDTDEGNGTLYWVVTESSTAPSAAQVQAGQDENGDAAADSGSQAVSGTGTQNISGGFTGLTASTTYYAHFCHVDAAENESTVVSSSSFQTDAPPDLAPVVEITVPAGNITVSAGTTIVVAATSTDAVDGDLSSSIEWSSSNTDDGTSGALGTGASIQIDTTGWSEDSRTITATSTDSNEGTGTDSFTLTIGAAPEPTDNPYLLARAKAAALGGF